MTNPESNGHQNNTPEEGGQPASQGGTAQPQQPSQNWQGQPQQGYGQPQGNWQGQQAPQNWQTPPQGNWQAQPQQGYVQPQQSNWQGQQYGAQPQQGAWQGQPQQGNWQAQQPGNSGPGTGEKISAAVGQRAFAAATSLQSKTLPRLMGGILGVLAVLQLIAGLLAWYRMSATASFMGITAGGDVKINGFGSLKVAAEIPFEGKHTEREFLWQAFLVEVVVLALVVAAAVLVFRNFKFKMAGILAAASGGLGVLYAIIFSSQLRELISSDAEDFLDMVNLSEQGKGFGFYLSVLISLLTIAVGVWLIVKKPAEIDAQRNKFLGDVANRSSKQANAAQQPAQPQGNWQGQQYGGQPQQGNWQAQPQQYGGQPQQGNWQGQPQGYGQPQQYGGQPQQGPGQQYGGPAQNPSSNEQGAPADGNQPGAPGDQASGGDASQD
ncbi:hypothetical protein [uncultured Corynebacterium sp.]|uniref:hypothetical protein n=1 Tax=uncultured Corynebacterium sp. TaxID=159447 RepID=UPI00288ABBC4|nr:hypothetical protein [uncultured Corynebacterium sp.]